MLVVEPTRKEGREGKKRKKERHKLIIIFLSEQIFLTTTLWSLHDNSFMTSLHVAICPWGTNYALLAYPYVLSPPPPPNSLAPLSVFSWYSFLVEWPQTQAVSLLQLVESGSAEETAVVRKPFRSTRPRSGHQG